MPKKSRAKKKRFSKKVLIVEGIIFTPKGVLLLKRSSKNSLYIDKWQFPGGKAKKGESSLGALKREVFEETGCKCSSPRLLKKITFSEVFLGRETVVSLSVFSCRLKKGNFCLSRDHSKFKFVKKSKILPSSLTPVSKISLFGL